MTYNFDPDKWYDNELFMIQAQLKKKELSKEAFDQAIEDLEQKHDKMWQRLDGTYKIGPSNG